MLPKHCNPKVNASKRIELAIISICSLVGTIAYIHTHTHKARAWPAVAVYKLVCMCVFVCGAARPDAVSARTSCASASAACWPAVRDSENHSFGEILKVKVVLWCAYNLPSVSLVSVSLSVVAVRLSPPVNALRVASRRVCVFACDHRTSSPPQDIHFALRTPDLSTPVLCLLI